MDLKAYGTLLFFIRLTLNPQGLAALSGQELAESCGDDVLIRVSYGGFTLVWEEDFWGGAHFLGVWCVINICVLIIFFVKNGSDD